MAGGSQLCRCPADGLIFADPMSLPGEPHALFSAAYSGRVAEAEMRMFHHRLVWRRDLLSLPAASSQALAPVHHAALAYIRDVVPPERLVLDIGCGSGLFLQSVVDAGHRVAGIEVAAPAVAFLRESDFSVFHGTVEEVPAGLFQPALCTSFFVLHHLTDPLGFLATIRTRFPGARLVLTEHYFGPRPARFSTLNVPPRRLTAWSPESLSLALQKSGFRVSRLEIIESEPYHPWVDSPLMRFYCRYRSLIPAAVRPRMIVGYIKGRRAAFRVLRKLVGKISLVAQEHLLAVAEPE